MNAYRRLGVRALRAVLLPEMRPRPPRKGRAAWSKCALPHPQPLSSCQRGLCVHPRDLLGLQCGGHLNTFKRDVESPDTIVVKEGTAHERAVYESLQVHLAHASKGATPRASLATHAHCAHSVPH